MASSPRATRRSPHAVAFNNGRNLSPSKVRRDRSASPNRVHRGNPETSPLITEYLKPPMANTEAETFDNEDNGRVPKPQPGVDDSFFNDGGNNPDAENYPPIFTRAGEDATPASPRPNNGRRPVFPSSFPDSEFGGVNTDLESIPDINVYQHKKTLAQGMMDLALFSANANQLRYVLESGSHMYYYPGLTLIGISLILQVLIGVGLIWNSRYNVKDKKEICIANKINNFTIIGIFLVTVINVFISAFGTTSGVPSTSQQSQRPFPISFRSGEDSNTTFS